MIGDIPRNEISLSVCLGPLPPALNLLGLMFGVSFGVMSLFCLGPPPPAPQSLMCVFGGID